MRNSTSQTLVPKKALTGNYFLDLINSINKTGRINRSANRENIIKITEYIPIVDIVGIFAKISNKNVKSNIVLPIPTGVPTSINDRSMEYSSDAFVCKFLW